ncbi:MAG: dockerin type I domain-containing protein [Candidatus Saccharimonadia bacterium]
MSSNNPLISPSRNWAGGIIMIAFVIAIGVYVRFGTHAANIAGDANGDGVVNITDLSILASNWGATGATWAQGDFNGDGVVNILDLSILATNWGSVTSSGVGPYPTSFWDNPLASTGTVAANSATLVANLVHQYQTNYGTFTVQDSAFSIPIFTVSSGQSTVKVTSGTGSDCSGGVYAGLQAQINAVPIPAGAYSATGTDHGMIIYQPSSQSEWEFWDAENNGGNWTACWGGEITNMSTANGVFPNPYGENATGLSYLASTVTEADIQSGSINHAMAVQLVDTSLTPCFVAPADRCDGWTNAADAVPEGTWYRLDPSVNVNSLTLTPYGKMVAIALQKYGMFVSDTSGAVALVGEDIRDWAYTGHTGTDPITAAFNGQPDYSALNGIPWNQLQVLNPPN